MKLTYQTGIATLIQLATMTVLNIFNGLYSSVHECTTASGGDCIENIILSLLYFMVLTFWLAVLWVTGAAAQTQRSKRLALLLMGGEFMVFVVALFNAKHWNNGNYLNLITSLTDAALAAWIILLAFRLMRSRGGRVTASARSRRRRLSSD